MFQQSIIEQDSNIKNEKLNSSKKIMISCFENGGDSAVMYEHYGDILFELKDLEGAKKNWLESIKKDPKNENLKEKNKKIYNTFILRFLITILLSVTVYSQDENSLINKKNLLLEEIELSKKTLNSAKNQKIISTKELQALNAYIKVRTNLKNTILQQRDSIELYKQEILNKIQINNKKISTIKDSYKSLIREIYFNDFGINLISFIFSTSSFKDKIGKYVYYKEKEQYRQNLLYELDYLKNELISFNNNLNENINLKDALLKEFNLEKDSLEILKKKKENLTNSLTKQEKKLSDFIKVKKKEAQQIESEIAELQKKLKLSKNYQQLDSKFEGKKKKYTLASKKRCFTF